MAAPHRLKGPPTRVIARRGHVREAQENTLAALEAALRSGADGAAVDVATTRDGTLVCFADDPPTRARLLGCAARSLAERDADEVASLELPAEVRYGSDAFCYGATAGIARLDDALELLAEGSLAVLRLAPPTSSLPNAPTYRVAGRAAELVQRMGLLDRVVVTSSDALALHRARRATRGRIHTAFEWNDSAALVGAWRRREEAAQDAAERTWRRHVVRALDRVKTSGPARRLLGSATAAAIEFTALGVELIHDLSSRGSLTGTFTLFPLDLDGIGHGLDGTLQARILARLVANGLDWVETDDPQRARAVVDRGWAAALVPHR